MKKFLLLLVLLIAVTCTSAYAKTVVTEYEGFKCTWTDGNVYIEGTGELHEDIVCNMFQPEYGEEDLVIQNGEWRYKRVELSEGITDIPALSFRVTVNFTAIIEELVVPSTVKFIDSDNFHRLEAITVHKDNPVYASHGGALYTKDMTTFVAYPRLRTDKHYDILKGVTALNGDSFDNAVYLESVTIPEGVVTIPAGTFSQSKKLKSVTLPSTIRVIGEYAFHNTSLNEISIPEGVETLPTFSLQVRSTLERIYLPRSLKALVGATVDTKNLKFVYYGGSKEDWEKIEIKHKQTLSSNDFSEAVFRYNATGLPSEKEELEIVPLNDKYPSGYFNDDKTVAWYVDENSVLHVHGYGRTRSDPAPGGFYKPWAPYSIDETSYHLKGLIVHEGITEIGANAFDLFSYDTIELPTTLKKIGSGAFADVFADKLVIRGVTSLFNYTFPRSRINEIIFPDNLQYIESGCFVATMNGGNALTSITLPKSIQFIGNNEAIPSTVTDIYYEGSRKEWDKVQKLTRFNGVTIHFLSDPLSDVPQNHWAREYIEALYEKDIVGGMSPNSFEPESHLTWGQALKLLLVSCAKATLSPTRDHWASGYLDYAKFRQWMHPSELYDDGLDTKITRLRFCQLAAGVKMIVGAPDHNPFTDTDDPMVLALYNAGIIGGTSETTFSPDEYLTRAQISKIIYLLMNK